MRIAYVTTYDPFDVANWSGLGAYIARALEQQHITLEYISVDADPLLASMIPRARNLVANAFRRRSLIHRSPAVLRPYSRQVEAALHRTAVDKVFSPGSLAVAYLDCRKPIVFWTDATFAAMLGFYPEYSRPTHGSIVDGNRAEQSSLSRAALAMYSSEWAAQSAIQSYSAEPSKVSVVPFGANVEWRFSLDRVKAFIAARPTDRCNLLFVGVDWSRKGGDLAVEIAQRVEEAGVSVRLDIVGCQPPRRLPSFARVHGYISKAVPSSHNALQALFQEAHFLLLPSRAEAYGLVAAEAFSVGVPCIATAVGGLPTVVRHGTSGYCLPPHAPADQYAALLLSVFNSPSYADLALSAFADFEQRLNWRVAGSQAAALLRDA